MNFLEMWMYHTDAANVIRIAGGHYPPISDLHNRVAAGVFQRFQNTMLCSAGIGAAPQQAEIAHFHISRNGRFGAYVLHMHCLLVVCYTFLSIKNTIQQLVVHILIFSVLKKHIFIIVVAQII